MQVDEEPAIRTNTTILLGNIASHLNEGVSICNNYFVILEYPDCLHILFEQLVSSVIIIMAIRFIVISRLSSDTFEFTLQMRKRVLINAFTVRALRDTFSPARGAGIGNSYF